VKHPISPEGQALNDVLEEIGVEDLDRVESVSLQRHQGDEKLLCLVVEYEPYHKVLSTDEEWKVVQAMTAIKAVENDEEGHSE
jgi:hypothetical protein